jgi:hypothetical protein
MLRHSRAETYAANKKYKERDKNHTGKISYKAYLKLAEEEYLKKKYLTLREYLRSAWGI